MAGIFAFYPFGEGRENWEAARFIYYGLSALQGRGQETVSLATYSKDEFDVKKVKGLVDEAFKEGEKISKGYLGIGQVSAYEDDFIVHVKEPLELVLVCDGNPIANMSKGNACEKMAKRLSELLSKIKDTFKACEQLVKEFDGAYSILALTEREEIIALRDPLGVKPLEVGAVGFDLGVIASESCALDVIGANHTGSVENGELVVFDPLSIKRKKLASFSRAYCSFEYVYLARPDSQINNIPVYSVRERIGKILAKECPAKGDVVIGVPETAIPFATSYSNTTGVQVKLGFVRTGKHTRTAIKPTQFERLMGVQLKLNPIRDSIDGKDVILIDDSVVRGNTLKNTVLNLKRKGARKVHVRIGSPAIVSFCPFGTEIPPKDELIGRALSREEIAEILGADSFAFLSIDGLVEAIGLSKDELCLGCFTGKYPNVRKLINNDFRR